MSKVKEHDTVRSRKPVTYGSIRKPGTVPAGTVGTIVGVWGAGKAYEVEFPGVKQVFTFTEDEFYRVGGLMTGRQMQTRLNQLANAIDSYVARTVRNSRHAARDGVVSNKAADAEDAAREKMLRLLAAFKDHADAMPGAQ